MYDKTDDGQSRIFVLPVPLWCRVNLKTEFALSVVNAGVEAESVSREKML